jgi:hypothetical protein
MARERGLTELNHLKYHNAFTDFLNSEGCHFGELLGRTVAEMQKKLISKVANFESTAQVMLDLGKKNKSELEGIKKMSIDAIACTHAARQAVNDMAQKAEIVRDRFDRVGWRLLWIVLGGNGLFLAANIAVVLWLKK